MAARRFAHSLKSMAGNFAASRIEAVACKIEVKAESIGTAVAETANLERAIRQTEMWLAKAG
jgi:HPt (histidine-containing phosphotransfer) domain-containing protein